MAEHQHTFLFLPGSWIGEGDVTFSASPDKVHFFTKWEVKHGDDGLIRCQQTVEIRGVEEQVTNSFTISSLTEKGFHILLQNEMLREVSGKGFIDTLKLAWEFREEETFEGFEVYELQENGEYHMHAEYSSPDQFRTIIDGRIWMKKD